MSKNDECTDEVLFIKSKSNKLTCAHQGIRSTWTASMQSCLRKDTMEKINFSARCIIKPLLMIDHAKHKITQKNHSFYYVEDWL